MLGWHRDEEAVLSIQVTQQASVQPTTQQSPLQDLESSQKPGSWRPQSRDTPLPPSDDSLWSLLPSAPFSFFLSPSLLKFPKHAMSLVPDFGMSCSSGLYHAVLASHLTATCCPKGALFILYLQGPQHSWRPSSICSNDDFLYCTGSSTRARPCLSCFLFYP